jgi:regulator of RNase E activity RraA
VSDDERFEMIHRELHSSVIGDVLDSLGRFHQFLPPGIRALSRGFVLVGRAMPVLVSDVFGIPTRPFGRLTDALDDLRPGEVYLARAATQECAAWGEIMTAAALSRDAAGAVIDGYHRDTRGVLAQGLPVFSRGSYGQDAGARAAVADFRVPIEIGRVVVHPGDMVVGDVDGVVVVPRHIEDEVVERALAKVAAEAITRRAIISGMSSTEALDTYGVL